MAGAQTVDYGNGIVAVDTDYLRPLLDASHLIIEGGRAAFVDTGTNHSVPLLLDALAQHDLDPGDVDYIFLTHVHLDHAGGAGLLAQSLPKARVIVHPRGARHMIDPAKLIKGAQAVYGEESFAKMYGDIQPIPAWRVAEAGDGETYSLNGRELTCFYTEGHARHHYCLHDPASAGVFTGDSFGISYREFDTARGEFIFPTTTPVHFDPDEAHRSVDLILERKPEALYLTHYSRVTSLTRLAADMHAAIDSFVAIARRHADAESRTDRIEASMFEYLAGRARAHGVTMSDDDLHALLDMDIILNTQGLEFWLEHGSPTDRR